MVTAENAAHWNAKLSEARDNLELIRQKHQQLVDALAGISANDDLPSLLQEMRRWVDLLDRAGDDFTIKRNLILLVVKNVKCIDHEGHIEISVMTKGKKWRREGDSNPR